MVSVKRCLVPAKVPGGTACAISPIHCLRRRLSPACDRQWRFEPALPLYLSSPSARIALNAGWILVEFDNAVSLIVVGLFRKFVVHGWSDPYELNFPF